jgi:thiol-disulfide isomerase/thioredoxin
MYGAFWCPHCAKVKKEFGESFRYINYVECDPRGENEQSLLCLEKKIENYATFEFNNDPSTRLIGEPTFEELAAASGCAAPEEK